MSNYGDIAIEVDLPIEQAEYVGEVGGAIRYRYPGARVNVYPVNREDFRGSVEVRTIETRNTRRRLHVHLRNVGRIVNSIVPA